jgi:hypothetical protein
VLPEDELLCDNYTEFRLQWQDGQKRRYTILKDQDFHAMGKSYLEKIIANQG